MRFLPLLLLLSCADPNVEARTRNAIKGTQYAVELDKCYETSKTMAEYELCAKKTDEKFGKKP
jgi:hypothetical protein